MGIPIESQNRDRGRLFRPCWMLQKLNRTIVWRADCGVILQQRVIGNSAVNPTLCSNFCVILPLDLRQIIEVFVHWIPQSPNL
jgi:hypothetical protein